MGPVIRKTFWQISSLMTQSFVSSLESIYLSSLKYIFLISGTAFSACNSTLARVCKRNILPLQSQGALRTERVTAPRLPICFFNLLSSVFRGFFFAQHPGCSLSWQQLIQKHRQGLHKRSSANCLPFAAFGSAKGRH